MNAKIALPFSLALAALLVTTPALAQDEALLAAEKARGVLSGGTGVEWIVTVSGSKDAKFRAVSQNKKIFAEVLEPADSQGRKYIAESKGAMWFWKPGLSSPISVSKRERLTGDAAIGDVASTSYVDGYKVAGQTDGEIGGEAATVYTLKANSLGDTYAEIRYWVTKNGHLGKKAEFYTRGGKLMRTATMEYGNQVEGRPFLSRMTIQDGNRTIHLSFSGVKLGRYPDSLFDRKELGGGRPRAGGPRK